MLVEEYIEQVKPYVTELFKEDSSGHDYWHLERTKNLALRLQETEGGDTMNSITGIKDTYYSKNHGENRAGRLKRATIILASLIAVLTIAFFILNAIYGSNLWS